MTTRETRSSGATSRRRFIAGSVGVIAAFGMRKATDAFAAVESKTPHLVWRLDSHWGYPVGDRKRTHCQCRACIGHSTNKVFATQADAESGRVHKHCECQARAVQINPDGYEKLFQGKSSTDLRYAGVADLYAELVVPSH